MKMNYDKAIRMFGEPEEGFLWKLRQGRFIEEECRSFLDKLASLTCADDECIPRRLVSLLWYIPLFMEWQTERVLECGSNQFDYSKAVTSIRNEVERILGVP